MTADITRDTFDLARRFRRVLLQQGRVQLDADYNEQTAILLHYLETLATDLIGPFGGPEDQMGFELGAPPGKHDLTIGVGRYYVDGLLCENTPATEEPLSYFAQPDLPLDALKDKLPTAPVLAYLDVFERHVSALEEPTIREIALEGVDTATRAKVVWQVRFTAKAPLDNAIPVTKPAANAIATDWAPWVELFQPANRGRLAADVPGDPAKETEPCGVSPGARYRGDENQLYRVEIHDGGPAGEAATFKWSRNNASVCFSILRSADAQFTVADLGRDERTTLVKGSWVELVDDRIALGTMPRLALFKVAGVDSDERTVTLDVPEGTSLPVYDDKSTLHPLLRRWDSALVPLAEAPMAHKLENGIEVRFAPPDTGTGAIYRTGDYWLIPARTATGNVEWPRDDAGEPLFAPPRGVQHHYAPLAVIDPTQEPLAIFDLRRTFTALGK